VSVFQITAPPFTTYIRIPQFLLEAGSIIGHTQTPLAIPALWPDIGWTLL
jgi:hypothetical protein